MKCFSKGLYLSEPVQKADTVHIAVMKSGERVRMVLKESFSPRVL